MSGFCLWERGDERTKKVATCFFLWIYLNSLGGWGKNSLISRGISMGSGPGRRGLILAWGRCV